MSAQRMLFLTVAILLLVGIFLTGWKQAHWFLYVLTGLLLSAGITGFCPTFKIYQKLGFK